MSKKNLFLIVIGSMLLLGSIWGIAADHVEVAPCGMVGLLLVGVAVHNVRYLKSGNVPASHPPQPASMPDGQAAFTSLIADLGKGLDIAEKAAETLGRLGNPLAAKHLAGFINHNWGNTILEHALMERRGGYSNALVQLGSTGVLQSLNANLLPDPHDSYSRHQAAEYALQNFGDSSSQPRSEPPPRSFPHGAWTRAAPSLKTNARWVSNAIVLPHSARSKTCHH